MKIQITIDTDVDKKANALAQDVEVKVSGQKSLRDLLRLRSFIHSKVDEYFDEIEEQPKASTLHPE